MVVIIRRLTAWEKSSNVSVQTPVLVFVVPRVLKSSERELRKIAVLYCLQLCDTSHSQGCYLLTFIRNHVHYDIFESVIRTLETWFGVQVYGACYGFIGGWWKKILRPTAWSSAEALDRNGYLRDLERPKGLRTQVDWEPMVKRANGLDADLIHIQASVQKRTPNLAQWFWCCRGYGKAVPNSWTVMPILGHLES